MDTQTIVNRIEELYQLAESTNRCYKNLKPRSRKMPHQIEGEIRALYGLLVWLKSNGIEPDTK